MRYLILCFFSLLLLFSNQVSASELGSIKANSKAELPKLGKVRSLLLVNPSYDASSSTAVLDRQLSWIMDDLKIKLVVDDVRYSEVMIPRLDLEPVAKIGLAARKTNSSHLLEVTVTEGTSTTYNGSPLFLKKYALKANLVDLGNQRTTWKYVATIENGDKAKPSDVAVNLVEAMRKDGVLP